MLNANIRVEEPSDIKSIRAMHLRAFGEDSPGQLVDDLRDAKCDVISLVYEHDGQILGHVLFSRLDAPFRALTMAPVGVCPTMHKRGIGTALILKGLEHAMHAGWQVAFVLGDPAYYQRFGFSATAALGYTSPYRGPANMAILLDPNAPTTGVVKFPSAFDQDIIEHQARGY